MSTASASSSSAPAWQWCLKAPCDPAQVADCHWHNYGDSVNEDIENAFRQQATKVWIKVMDTSYRIILRSTREVLQGEGCGWMTPYDGFFVQADETGHRCRYVRRLTQPTVQENRTSDESGVCSICLRAFRATEYAACQPWDCVHRFHCICAQEWMNKQKAQEQPYGCPHCRKTNLAEGRPLEPWTQGCERKRRRNVRKGNLTDEQRKLEMELALAAFAGDEARVGTLLEEGVHANADNAEGSEEGATSLMSAALQGHLDICRMLLQQSADPNEAGGSGLTALMVAGIAGNVGIVRFLLEQRADPMAVSDTNCTALDFVQQCDPDEQEICDILRNAAGR
eukprot:TRINITY_DN16909_c0_g3_i1.p1 TRINITY_DN16909_c0_g3~~TRINITY_DN16909_c0_g3_i1.p1  ORF type:complete len:339 (+),score=52.30 TRINITY_DN16909_c0_g3_i1:99-1115(+)